MIPVQVHDSTADRWILLPAWDLLNGQLSPEWNVKKCWGGWDPPLCPSSSELLLGLGISISSGCCAQAHCPGLGVQLQFLDEVCQRSASLFILRQTSLKGCVLPEATFIVEKV